MHGQIWIPRDWKWRRAGWRAAQEPKDLNTSHHHSHSFNWGNWKLIKKRRKKPKKTKQGVGRSNYIEEWRKKINQLRKGATSIVIEATYCKIVSVRPLVHGRLYCTFKYVKWITICSPSIFGTVHALHKVKTLSEIY